ncbi:MAG: winged helix-turn-helix domain-containing protein [Pseudomonadota bacterium]
MGSSAKPSSFRLGSWTVDLSAGRLENTAGSAQRLEPKVADLLRILAEADGQVVSRETLFDRLWPGVTVGEDTLTRCVFKLRRALGDDPKAPSFVETVPKRGYRLMVSPEPLEHASQDTAVASRRWLPAGLAAAIVLLIGATALVSQEPVGHDASVDVQRAHDRYMLFTRADNEAAIDLYQRALSKPKPEPGAEAGLAAALVQRVVRWPEAMGSERKGTSTMHAALSLGLTETPEAQETLLRAQALAERSVRRHPGDADAWRVVGLVRTAQNDIDGALEAYDNALHHDPQNWGVQINLSELYDMRGEKQRAYAALTGAYEAMGRSYHSSPQHIAPWRAPLGVLIARRDEEAGRLDDAEAWYRRVLRDEPLHEDATVGFAALLASTGRDNDMHRLCNDYEERTGQSLSCAG